MKILIAYDGSDCADRAIDDLRRAGLPPEAEATVISAADVLLPIPPPSSYEVVESAFSEDLPATAIRARERARRAVAEARQSAIAASEHVKAVFPAWDVRVEAVGDSPAWAVIKKAEEWEADLIAMGAHGRSAIGRLLLGSVSHQVVTKAACTDRVARPRAVESDSPVRILIGVDGSRGAEAAVREVFGRAWPPGSQTLLVAVLDPTMMTAIERIQAGDRDENDWVRRMAAASANELRAAELVVSAILKEGDPKRVLVDEAEQWGADSIFVGARGLRLLQRFLLSSVSAAVAARAHCSVEVVRPRATA